MADAVDSNVIFSGERKYIARYTNLSDGTGESAVVKVDKSTLVGPDGTEPGRLVVEQIQFVTNGMSVRLDWDHDTDDEIAFLNGAGYFDYREGGGLIDPASTGGTGDIIFTTAGHSSGDTYDITLHLRLKD